MDLISKTDILFEPYRNIDQICTDYYRPSVLSWRFCVQSFSPYGVAISGDIANYGYDLDFCFKG